MSSQDHISQLLKQYAEGRCTTEEKAIVEQWYAALDLNASGDAATSPEQLWDKIAARTQPLAGQALHPLRRRLWMGATAAAAILALAVVFLLPQRSTPVRQTAAAGNIRMVALPDGSRMWLSAGSKVRYSKDFAEGRQVELEEGEAFFDVVHNDALPFTVNARGTQTLVLGTAFRVSVGSKVEVAVVSGKVKVTAPDQAPVVVLPREVVALNSAAAPEVSATPAVPAENLSAAPARQGWTAQRVDLDDVSTGELAQLLESVYGVHIAFSEAHLKACRSTISIDTGRPLTEILDKLKLINHFEYTVTHEGVKIYGAGCGVIK